MAGAHSSNLCHSSQPSLSGHRIWLNSVELGEQRLDILRIKHQLLSEAERQRQEAQRMKAELEARQRAALQRSQAAAKERESLRPGERTSPERLKNMRLAKASAGTADHEFDGSISPAARRHRLQRKMKPAMVWNESKQAFSTDVQSPEHVMRARMSKGAGEAISNHGRRKTKNSTPTSGSNKIAEPSPSRLSIKVEGAMASPVHGSKDAISADDKTSPPHVPTGRLNVRKLFKPRLTPEATPSSGGAAAAVTGGAADSNASAPQTQSIDSTVQSGSVAPSTSSTAMRRGSSTKFQGLSVTIPPPAGADTAVFIPVPGSDVTDSASKMGGANAASSSSIAMFRAESAESKVSSGLQPLPCKFYPPSVMVELRTLTHCHYWHSQLLDQARR